MRMKKGENIFRYVNQIKEVVSAIKSIGGVISSEEVVSYCFRTLLPIYAIRVSSIQEFRAMHGNDLTLSALVGRFLPSENGLLPKF